MTNAFCKNTYGLKYPNSHLPTMSTTVRTTYLRLGRQYLFLCLVIDPQILLETLAEKQIVILECYSKSNVLIDAIQLV